MQTPSDRLQACLAFTLLHEGGYQAREDDPGNWLGGQLIGTNFGISAPALAGWLGTQGEGLTAERMQALTLAEARAIYAARYWNVVRGDDLPGGVDLMLFDFAVLAGPATSVRIAQAELANALGAITVDGFVGPRTLGAIQRLAPRALIPRIAAKQAAFLKALPGAPDNPGWFSRNKARLKRANQMLQEA